MKKQHSAFSIFIVRMTSRKFCDWIAHLDTILTCMNSLMHVESSSLSETKSLALNYWTTLEK